MGLGAERLTSLLCAAVGPSLSPRRLGRPDQDPRSESRGLPAGRGACRARLGVVGVWEPI